MPDTEIVVIPDNDEDNTPDVETGDTTVIVEPPADTDTDNGMSTVELVERLVNLERDVQELRSQLWDAEGNAAWAKMVAEEAIEATKELAEQDEEIVEATDEAIVETVEDATDENGNETDLEVEDKEPVSAKVHPLFRPASDWFRK